MSRRAPFGFNCFREIVHAGGERPTKTLRVRVSTGESTGDPRAEADVIRAKPLLNIDIDKTVKTGHEDLPAAFIPTWL